MTLKALEPDDYPFFDYRRFAFSLGIETPEGLWLSGSTAVLHDPDSRRMVVTGDLVQQADVIFDKMRAALVPAERTLRDLTRLVRYVTSAALPDLARLDAHQAALLSAPDVSTIVVDRLLRDTAVIEMEAAIAPAQRSLSIFPPDGERDAAEEIRRALDGKDVLRLALFSTGPVAIPDLHGLTVCVPSLPDGSEGVQAEAVLASPGAGIVHAAALGDPAGRGIAAQCRDAYDRLSRDLQAAGSSLAQVVKTTEFVAPAGLADYRDTATIRREVFAAPYPAATGVICSGFPDSGTLIAIEATAHAGAAS